MLIYHIVLPDLWKESETQPQYAAASLETEGFIHCSFADQLDAVLDRYYKDTGDVLVLTIETKKLTSKLVSEPSTNNEMYPHIYGKINRDAVTAIETRQKRDG